MNKSLIVAVGLAIVGATASAHAQSGYGPMWPVGPSSVRPYGGPLVPAYEVATIVRSMGLEPLAPPIRRLATYIVWATDQTGMRVRVLVDARYGDVLAVRPAARWRYAPADGRSVEPYGREYGPGPGQPIHRSMQDPDARVPLPRDRMAFAAPMPRPRPMAPGTDAQRSAAPTPVALPAQPTVEAKKDAGAKAPDPAKQPDAARPGSKPGNAPVAKKEVAKAATSDEVTGSVAAPVAMDKASTASKGVVNEAAGTAIGRLEEARAVAGVSPGDLPKISGSTVSGEAAAGTERKTESKTEN